MPAVPFLLAGAAFSGAAASIGTAIAASITTAAVSTAAATAIGIGTISAVATAVQGGSVSDVLKSAVLGGLTSYVGGTIAADIGTSVAQDAFFSAIDAGFAGSAAMAVSNLAGSALTGAITSSFNALISERDPIEAFIKGGLSAGVSSAVSSAVNEVIKEVPGLKEIRGTAAGSAVERALKTSIANSILTNKDFDQSFIESLASSGTGYLLNAAQSTLIDFSKDLIKDSELVKRSEEQVDGLINREKDLVTTINNYIPNVQSIANSIKENESRQNYWAEQANSFIPTLDDLGSRANSVTAMANEIGSIPRTVLRDQQGFLTNREGATIGNYYFAREEFQETYSDWESGNSWTFPSTRIVVVNNNTGEKLYDYIELIKDVNANAEYINNTYPTVKSQFDNAINNLNGAKAEYSNLTGQFNNAKNTLDYYKTQLGDIREQYSAALEQFNQKYKAYETTLQNFVSAEAQNVQKIENLINDVPQVISSYEADYGRTPTEQELASLITGGNGDITKGYVSFDAKNVSEKEAEAFLGELGYNPTKEEVKQFTGQIAEDAVKTNIASYVEPKVQKISDVFDYLNQGKLSPEQAQDELLRFGFKTEQMPAIFAANADAVDRSRKAQDIVNDYADIGSDLSREAAVQRLVQEAGVTETAANNYLSRVDAQVTARNEYQNAVSNYVKGVGDENAVRQAMDAAGLTGDKADNTLLALRAIREGGNLTSSELTNAAVANLNQWFNIGGGRQVAFKTNTEDGGLYVASARDASGKDVTNDFYGLSPQGLKNFIDAQQAIQKTAPTIKAGEASVPQELASQGSNLGLGGQTGLIKNNFATVQKSYFDNLLRAYSAMSPEDRAKIATASGATTDMKILKDIDAQYKSIDQQRQTALNNGQKTIADFLLAADTRVENKASHYYLTKGVQPSTAMGLALEDIQAGNLYNRINLSEAQDSTFPFETQQFINQFRGTPAGDTLANTLANAYAITGLAVSNTLNGSLGISLHIAEALGLDNFANDFQKMSVGIRQAGEDAFSIADADTRAHKNFIGGLSNIVSAIPWLAMGPAGLPGLVASAGSITYGNEYLQGRLAGLDIPEASARAGTFAIIEMVTERLGLSELSQILKPMWRTVPTDQLAKVASESLITNIAKYGTKEQLGELTAFSLQVGADKYLDFGINKNITGMDVLQGALDTIQQTFWAAGAGAGIGVGLRGGMTPDNSGAIKVISPDGSQGLVELGNGSVIRVDLPENLGLQVGEQVNVNALQNDVVYVPDDVNEKFSNLQQQVNDAYQNELGRIPSLEELNFNIKRLADGATINSIVSELNNSPQGKLLDDQRAFTSQTDEQIASNARTLLDQGKTTYADFKAFMDSMGLATDRQLNVLDTITPRSTVAGTVTSIVGDNAIVTGTNGQMYTMLRVGPNNYLMQVGDQVNLGVPTVVMVLPNKPTATLTVEVTTKIADVIAASVSKSTSVSLSQSVSEAAVSTSISNSQSVSTSLSQSESISVSAATSISESVSQSVSLSQSVSTADMERAISISNSVSQSLSVSQAISLSASISEATSLSVSNSQSVSTSISQATSVSEALSLSVSISEQIEKDRLKGLSISASVSESVSKAVSISESVSVATSISESTSASISNSQSVSVAASISESVSFSTSQSTSVSQDLSTQASISEAVSISVAASTSQSISVSQEVSKQVSISQSTSQSVALSQSVSQDQALSLAASISQSTSQSISEALSISEEAQAMLNASISQSQSISQEISANLIRGMSISASVSEALSVSQSISELIEASLSASLSQAATISVTEAISISETVAPTLSITQSLSIEPSVVPTVAPTISATQQITQTASFTQTPSLTMVITTTSLPPVTTTEVTTTEPLTTVIETTVTVPPVTPPPTSGTIPPVTPPVTTTSPPPTTTARPAVTTARPAVTTARPPTTTARPNTGLFPLFGIPAATGQQKTYVDYAQPNVPAPEFGPYDLFKAPNYLRPLQDTGNFGLAALIGAASESQQRNGDNQSQQNAESQGQAPKG